MRTVSFSNYTFKKFEKLKLESSIFNTEGKLYRFTDKNKWYLSEKVLKVFYNTEGDIFSNKLFTINSLIDNSDLIDIDEIVLPDKLAIVNSKVCGYTMPFIRGINLNLILKDFSISNEFKISLLKQISEILKKMDNLRKNSELKDFFINDLHEGNFIYNTDTRKLNVVDTDSFKINNNKPFAAKYLTPASSIVNIPKKYIQNIELRYPGFIVSNKNSDLYCFNIIILNYLFQNNVSKLSMENFYTYLNYLRTIGLPYRLVDKFAKLYEYLDNENIFEELDYITDSVLEKSNALAFHNATKKKV